MSSRNSRILISALAIIVIGGGVWLVWPTSPETPPLPGLPTPIRTTAPAPTASIAVPPTRSTLASAQAGPAASSPPSSQRISSPTVDSILADQSLDNLGAARALSALVADTTLSLNDRAEALAHLLNLSVGNENTLLLPLLKSPNLPDSLGSTILTDALNSPITWQADACLAVAARKTGKELHTQAIDHLAFLTGEDHGDDVNAWTLAVRTARKKWETAAPGQ